MLNKETADLINEKLQHIVYIDEERARYMREVQELMGLVDSGMALAAAIPTVLASSNRQVKEPKNKNKVGKEPKQRKSGKRGMSDEDRNEILNLNRGGKTDAEIMEETGASKSTVYRLLREAGLKSNKLAKEPKASRSTFADRLPRDNGRRGAMPVGKFQQVKIALSHQIPAETVAKELNLTKDEVHKAELAKTYEAYAA
jgi:hypothetical protein